MEIDWRWRRAASGAAPWLAAAMLLSTMTACGGSSVTADGATTGDGAVEVDLASSPADAARPDEDLATTAADMATGGGDMAMSGAEVVVKAGGSLIAVDATHLYWAAAKEVQRVPLANPAAAPEVVYKEPKCSIQQLALDAAGVYWTALCDIGQMQSEIRACPLPGLCNGAPRTLATAEPMVNGFAVDDKFVWWHNRRDVSILRAAKLQGPAARFLTGTIAFGLGIASDGTDVAWTGGGTPIGNGKLLVCPVGGCPNNVPRELDKGFAGGSVALAPGQVVYSATGGKLFVINRDGTGRLELGPAAKALAPAAGSVVVDGGTAFWLGGASSIYRCALSGCGGAPAEMAADALSAPVVNATHVYYVNQQFQVMRIAR